MTQIDPMFLFQSWRELESEALSFGFRLINEADIDPHRRGCRFRRIYAHRRLRLIMVTVDERGSVDRWATVRVYGAVDRGDMSPQEAEEILRPINHSDTKESVIQFEIFGHWDRGVIRGFKHVAWPSGMFVPVPADNFRFLRESEGEDVLRNRWTLLVNQFPRYARNFVRGRELPLEDQDLECSFPSHGGMVSVDFDALSREWAIVVGGTMNEDVHKFILQSPIIEEKLERLLPWLESLPSFNGDSTYAINLRHATASRIRGIIYSHVGFIAVENGVSPI